MKKMILCIDKDIQRMWVCVECQHENIDGSLACGECDSARPALDLSGTKIGPWILEGQLGEGGMAIVFLARHETLGGKAAVKLLRSEITHKKDVLERFRTEAKAASLLRHENLINVQDFGFQEGLGFYMLLEYLDGIDLELKIDEGPFPYRYVREIGRQIVDGLEAAHEARIIHRDLKPSNIFLVPRKGYDIPLVKILDFGIAKIQDGAMEGLQNEQQKLTQTGTILGTPFYLAPEQLRRKADEQLTDGVDIYAFGVIMFQMLVGQLPIEEATVVEQMVAIITKQPPLAGTIREDLSGTAIEVALHHLLAKERTDRPASIREAWHELEAALLVLEENNKEADHALRREMEIAYRPLLRAGQKKSFLATWGWAIALILLTAGGGWFVAYRAFQRKPETKTKVVIVRAKPERLPPLPRMQAAGTEAFNSKNYLAAISSWKKVVGSEKWKKGYKYYDPELYKYIGIAMAKRNQSYGALRQYKRYLRSGKLAPEQKVALKGLIASIQRRVNGQRNVAKKVDVQLASLLKQKKYKDAKNAYSMLYGIDSSMPKPLALAASTLRKKFPLWSLQLYKRLLKLDLSSEQRQKVMAERTKTRQDISQSRVRLLQKLESSMTQKSFRNSKKALASLLKKRGDDPSTHKGISDLLVSYRKTNWKLSKSLMAQYVQIVRAMRSQKSWSWRGRYVNKIAAQNTAKFRTAIETAKKMEGALVLFKKAKRRLAKGHFSQAIRDFEAISPRLETVAQGGSSFSAVAQKNFEESQDWIKRLKSSLSTWKALQKRFVEGRLKDASPIFLKYIEQIKGSGSENRYKRIYRNERKKFYEGERLLSAARRKYYEKKWWKAERKYIAYMVLYPKSYRKWRTERMIGKCKCNRGAPWKECPKKRKPPSR